MRKETEPPHGVAGHVELNAGSAGDEADVRQALHASLAGGADLVSAEKLEALSQLMGGVAHGFNNLLTVILGNLELLQMRLVGDATGLRHVSNALEGAKRGVELTQRMLAFARRENLEPGVVNLNEASREIVAALYAEVGSGVEIKADIARELWPIRVDLRHLELALVNLARNAREAMPSGGRLTVCAYNETIALPMEELAVGDYVRISVVDTGVGMSESTLARALDPFFTTKGANSGAGLGLPMVQGFAVQSGGALRISSRPGEGTKVELWLPRAANLVKPKPMTDAPPGGQQEVQPGAEPGVQASETAPPCTVLVVDDDALIVMVTSDRLQALGHHVFEVQSGRQALEVLRSSVRIDVVLTDHIMPGMTGLDLAREIRTNWPDIPIILATGCADLPDVEELRLTRLDKPYDLDTLGATVADLTRERCTH